MARFEFDLAVIGTGSAGMTAMRFGAAIGLRVVGIERDRLGGDCLWTGCVPSKALLSAAKAAHTMRTAAKWGLAPVEPEIDLDAVFARVRAVQQAIADGEDSRAHFEGLGVELRFGEARLVGPHQVAVDGRPVTAKHILVATGGRPAEPPIPGLEGARVLTTETLWEADPVPRALTIVGGGPIAIELAQAMTRLGARVTVLEREERVLPRDEPALVDRLVARLRAEGIDLRTGTEARDLEGDVLLAVGRRPNVEGLGLEELGIEASAKGIVVDEQLRTAVPSILAAGDVIGGPLFTHSAGFEAARAVRNAVFPGRATKGYGVPWCTYTDPELAHAGLTEAEARERWDDDVAVLVHDLGASDRAQAEHATDGELRLVTHKGRLVGAHLLSPSAGETIHELALAIERGLGVADLASVVHVYPTIATGVQQLAAQAVYARAARLKRLPFV
jgi:pyruvate/2-oxoglutarate dehydrogenase complex dihydrolipoamide dehydrogenase (E3) component